MIDGGASPVTADEMRFPNLPMTFRSIARVALLAAALTAGAPCLGQDVVPAARMQAFLREVEYPQNTGLVPYFPRRGDWTWEQTIRDEHGRRVGRGVWRFSAAETLRAIGAAGPACDSFNAGGGEFGPMVGSLASHLFPEGRWRRIGGNRFVPPDASASSPVFVEWRREDGAWVVSAFGDETLYSPHLLGVPAGDISRDTSRVAEGAGYAAGERWYVQNEPLLLEGGRRFIKYGLPRRFPEEERGFLRRVGVLGRVSFYAEAGAEGVLLPEVLYAAVSPGEFQPYQGFGPSPCE